MSYCVVQGKHGYSKRDAQTKKNYLEKQGRERMRIYPCPACNQWHLTHAHSERKRK